jgi:hypothetical protein
VTMRPVRIGSLVVMWLVAAAAPAQAGPCETAADGAIVCGNGTDTMRVFADTTSPDLRFAVAWLDRSRSGSAEPDVDDVDNVLVRLRDGAVLLKLGGNHWDTDKLRANRRDEIAVWSKDSRWMVEIANDRWDTFSLRAVALNGDTVIGDADLLPLIEKETRALRSRRKGSPSDGALSFRIDADEAPRLTAGGQLFLRALLFVPKSEDGQTAVDLRVQLKVKAGKLAPRLIFAKRVRG